MTDGPIGWVQTTAFMVLSAYVEAWCDSPDTPGGSAGKDALIAAWGTSIARGALIQLGWTVAEEAQALAITLDITVVVAHARMAPRAEA